MRIRRFSATKIKFKCPHCNKDHTSSDWKKATKIHFSHVYDIQLRLGARFICPSCSHEVRGNDTIPMKYDRDGNLLSEGWFSLHHYPCEQGV